MSKSDLSSVVISVLVVLVICIGSIKGWGEEKQRKEHQPTKWALPSMAQFGRLNLTISPDQRWLCFFRKRLEGEKPGIFLGVGKYVMLDTKTGEETSVEDFFKKGSISGLVSSTGELQFSSSGKHVLVHASPDMNAVMAGEICSLFLVNLESKDVTKLAGDFLVMGRWIGESVVITSMDMERINPVKLVDIANAKAKELRACGFVHACDPLGRFIIMEGDPKKLGKPAKAKESVGKNHLLAVNLEAEVIKDFGLTAGASIENAMLSREGKYLIYNTGPLSERQVRVVSVQDNHDRSIKSEAIPVAVSDNGIAIIAEGGSMGALAAVAKGNAPRDLGYVVTSWDVDGNMTRVLEKDSIIHVLAIGNRLYYVTATNKREPEVAFVALDALFGKAKSSKQ